MFDDMKEERFPQETGIYIEMVFGVCYDNNNLELKKLPPLMQLYSDGSAEKEAVC